MHFRGQRALQRGHGSAHRLLCQSGRKRVEITRLLQRCFIGAVLLGVPAGAVAQEATLTGTISDSTGAVLPGVTVTAVHESSGIIFESVTDGRGVFRVPVRIGNYRVTATLTGFTDATRSGVPVSVGQTVTLNLQMAPSGLQESVTVTGEAPLIDVTTSSLGSNISQAQMEELPLNGRNWQDLAMLAVGNKVNEVGTNEIAAEGTGNYQVNVDGQQITYEGGGLGNVQARFSRDAIAEFEYIANRFDATQGRSQGVQINAVTKSGTNTFLGSFGAYFRDDNFNAADHIVDRVLPYSNQQVSMTHGGPIMRDRFHYFANYEFERQSYSTVFTTPYPEFNLQFTAPREEHKAGLRLDYQFTPAMRASMRGAIWQNDQQIDQGFEGSSTDHPSFLVHTYRDSDQLQLTLTNVLGSRAVNEVRSGYSGLRNREQSKVPWPQHPAAATDGIVNGSPILTFQGFRFGPPGSVPQEIQQGNLSLRDDFTLSYDAAGRHGLKVGAEPDPDASDGPSEIIWRARPRNFRTRIRGRSASSASLARRWLSKPTTSTTRAITTSVGETSTWHGTRRPGCRSPRDK
jgi:carboxypeptidase family protein